jgi:hypothetical protein
MTILPQLEHDLFEAAEQRLSGPGLLKVEAKRPRTAVPVLFGALVTLAVVVIALTSFGHQHRQARSTPPRLHRGGPAPGGFDYPLGSVPTLRQLIANFAILRRPQTAQDHSWQPQCDCAGSARQLTRLTRFATALPGGYRVYVDVEQLETGGQLDMSAGSYVMNLDIVDPHRNVTSTSFGPNTQYTVYPLVSGGPRRFSVGRSEVWASVVPDGVSTVSWTIGCRSGAGTRGCAGTRAHTFTVPVIDNVAARQIPGPDNCFACEIPRQVIWRSADGRVVASFGGFGNLAAPPFVKGGLGSRVLRVLLPRALGSTKLGEPSASTIRTLSRLLGPAALANVQAGGCGVDHESVWTSPAVADPLTIFQRDGRFVGYQYGAPVNEIGLRLGPGAQLTTGGRLALGDTIGKVRRLYGAALTTSAGGGGTWRLTAGDGGLHGSVLPISYPLRAVTAQNQVATIEAGVTGCPSQSG